MTKIAHQLTFRRTMTYRRRHLRDQAEAVGRVVAWDGGERDEATSAWFDQSVTVEVRVDPTLLAQLDAAESLTDVVEILRRQKGAIC
jgi:hypothetical protein